MKNIEIIKPDDWHVHFRDNEILNSVVPETSKHFGRAIVMPNLNPPILTGGQAINYKKRIMRAVPDGDNFLPLMTVYLTEKTNKNEIKESYQDGMIFAAKLYPAGATTNSESGVKNINKVMHILEKMSEIGMPLLIHGEVTDKEVDVFDREKEFIDRTLNFICKELPELKITLEHITTKDACIYVKEGNKNLVASITPHHLALNRNALFEKGIRPHNYCLPILKREIHREALIEVATNGNKKFFLGTDTAPHLLHDKESECGCAGVFNASYAIQLITQIFDNEKSLPNLESFLSINGAKHYKLTTNYEKVKLFKSKTEIYLEQDLNSAKGKIKIFKPNIPIYWDFSTV